MIPPNSPHRRVPSHFGVDDACADVLDLLDSELLIPLDLPSDVPFPPRLTDVKVQPFLRAMIKCAPLFGRSYVIKNVLATKGDEGKLQRLASIWFNRIILLGESATWIHQDTMNGDLLLIKRVSSSPYGGSGLFSTDDLPPAFTPLLPLRLAKGLYIPARPPDQSESMHFNPHLEMRVEAFRNKVCSKHSLMEGQ